MSSLPPRRPRPTFQPRFTAAILYFLLLVLLYSRLLIAPELYEVWQTTPPGAEQEARANEVARETVGPRLPLAVALAIATVAAGAHYGFLPGLKRRGP